MLEIGTSSGGKIAIERPLLLNKWEVPKSVIKPLGIDRRGPPTLHRIVPHFHLVDSAANTPHFEY